MYLHTKLEIWQVSSLDKSTLQVLFNNNNNNGEFLYSAHTMLCALHTYYPWSLDQTKHFNLFKHSVVNKRLNDVRYGKQ